MILDLRVILLLLVCTSARARRDACAFVRAGRPSAFVRCRRCRSVSSVSACRIYFKLSCDAAVAF